MKTEIRVPGFDIRLWVSFEESYAEVERFLAGQGISEREVRDYVIYGKKKNINARTTYFPNNCLILIKMNYFDNSIRSVSILMHEIIHASLRIAEWYEGYRERELDNREEAVCYIAEYIFEDIMIKIQPTMVYAKEKRDMEWFYEITHKLKTYE